MGKFDSVFSFSILFSINKIEVYFLIVYNSFCPLPLYHFYKEIKKEMEAYVALFPYFIKESIIY